jgi:hypothetical protein
LVNDWLIPIIWKDRNLAAMNRLITMDGGRIAEPGSHEVGTGGLADFGVNRRDA